MGNKAEMRGCGKKGRVLEEGVMTMTKTIAFTSTTLRTLSRDVAASEGGVRPAINRQGKVKYNAFHMVVMVLSTFNSPPTSP